jgi:hypothetical protein
MNSLRENKPCACSEAIPFPSSAVDLQINPTSITLLVNIKEQYAFIQRGSFGYFYSLGRWKLQ